jgi:hypothetical protein
MTSAFSRRLAAATAAFVTVLPVLPVSAEGEQRVAPPARPIELACPTERVSGAEFTDTAGSVHRDAISCLSWYGIAQGSADGTYGGAGAVTRAQLASLLAKVLVVAGVELPETAEDAFSDDGGSVHESNLNALAALGIVNGTSAGTVNPDASVQRAQMATLLVSVLELVEGEELADAVQDYFGDDDENVHAAAINLLAELGIAAGRGDRTFDPVAPVLREQMATFLMRVVDRLVEDGSVRVPATLVLVAEHAAPGEVVEASVLGDGIASVDVAGCGFDGTVSDLDAGADGVQFELTVPATWPTGAPADGEQSGDVEDDCEFVVTVTFTDASTQQIEGKLAHRQDDDAGTTPPTTGGDAGTQPVEQPVEQPAQPVSG